MRRGKMTRSIFLQTRRDCSSVIKGRSPPTTLSELPARKSKGRRVSFARSCKPLLDRNTHRVSMWSISCFSNGMAFLPVLSTSSMVVGLGETSGVEGEKA